MADKERSLTIQLSGYHADVVEVESVREDVPPAEIVKRALTLYVVLVNHINDGEQIVLNLAEDDHDLPQLLHLDFYSPPSNAPNAHIWTVDLRRFLSGQVMRWPAGPMWPRHRPK